MGNKGGGTNSSQQTVNQPWQGVAPYLKQLYGGATQAEKDTPNAPWGGPLTASTRPESIAGQDYTMKPTASRAPAREPCRWPGT